MNVNMDEIIELRQKLAEITNWKIEHFDIWESTKGQPKITIRLGRVSTGA